MAEVHETIQETLAILRTLPTTRQTEPGNRRATKPHRPHHPSQWSKRSELLATNQPSEPMSRAPRNKDTERTGWPVQRVARFEGQNEAVE